MLCLAKLLRSIKLSPSLTRRRERRPRRAAPAAEPPAPLHPTPRSTPPPRPCLDASEVLLDDALVAVEDVVPAVVLEHVHRLERLDDVLLPDARQTRHLTDGQRRPVLPERLEQHARPVRPVRHGAEVRQRPLGRPHLALDLRNVRAGERHEMQRHGLSE